MIMYVDKVQRLYAPCFGMPPEFAETFTKRGAKLQIINLEQAP